MGAGEKAADTVAKGAATMAVNAKVADMQEMAMVTEDATLDTNVLLTNRPFIRDHVDPIRPGNKSAQNSTNLKKNPWITPGIFYSQQIQLYLRF